MCVPESFSGLVLLGNIVRNLTYQLLNVFAESTFGGNPLCVFEDARALSDEEMQALALQFNLSETVFLLPSERADARMRIFTPGTEMAFAGHPSIGAAAVVSDLLGNSGDVGDVGDVRSLQLECRAGLVSLQSQDQVWSFSPPKAAQILPCDVDAADIAAMLGLRAGDLLCAPVWVNTGSDQLLIAVNTPDAVQRARFDAANLAHWPLSSLQRRTAYVFARDETRNAASHGDVPRIVARYLFERPGGGVGEDPATGSACANLGAWLIAQQTALPFRYLVMQGAQMRRASQLYLDVDANKVIKVGGKVIKIGSGIIQI